LIWLQNVLQHFEFKSRREELEGDDEFEKSRSWSELAISETHHFSTVGSVYEDPNTQHFENYVEYIKNVDSEEIPDQFIPLNPPPVPKMVINEDDAEFLRSFEDATRYILFAAAACQRLRVNEEITRRFQLRWYSALADIYDKYRPVVEAMPGLKNDKDVERAFKIAEDVRRDKKKRNALAKEVMAGRRINRILDALHGQWHIIDLQDTITRDFLVNNSQDFINSLVNGIRWPDSIGENLPYVHLSTSGSDHQYIIKNNEVIPEDNNNSGVEASDNAN
jgi:hypothetical protein